MSVAETVATEPVRMPSKGGAEPGNVNAVKHARRSPRIGSVIVFMAEKFRAMEGTLFKLRKALEAQVSRAHGVGHSLRGDLDSAVGLVMDAERCRQKAQRLARAAEEAGDLDRGLELEKTALFMAQQRDQAIRRLGLGKAPDGKGGGNGMYQEGADQVAFLGDPEALERALAAEEAAAG